MLAPSQIPVDDSLPQLAEVASEAVMHALFNAHLKSGWRLVRLRIHDVCYQPRRGCLLRYELECEHESGEKTTLRLYGRAFVQGDVPAVFSARPPLATRIGHLPSYLPQASLALWSFPNDPGLSGVRDLWRLGGAMFDRVGLLQTTPWCGRRPEIRSVVVRYVPSEKCVVRHTFKVRGALRRFYAKVYSDTDVGVLYEQMQRLWESSRGHAPELQLPQPLGCDRSLRVIWSTRAPGKPLPLLLGNLDLPAAMRRIAAALAALHRGDISTPYRRQIADEKRRLQRARQALRRFYPTLERDIVGLLNELIDCTPSEIDTATTLHGDLHWRQVRLHADRVAFRDLDELAQGDPLFDVARFLSSFVVDVRGTLATRDVEQAQRVFLSTYAILTPWRIDPARLDWLMASMLIHHHLLDPVRSLSHVDAESIAALLSTAGSVARRTDWT